MHPLDVKGKEPINLSKGVFAVSGGAVAAQAVASGGQSWKVMKAPPRESLTNTAVAGSVAPARVSRTIIGGGSSARVVTLDRNSAIAYDAREHRFVNGTSAASAAQNATERSVERIAAANEAAARNSGAAAQMRGQAGAAANIRIPAATARAVAPAPRATTPAPRAMTPPPARSSGGSSGGGWGSGASASTHASAGPSATHSSAPSAAAPHASSGGGRPH